MKNKETEKLKIKKEPKKKSGGKNRAAEIFSVFAKHNFYVNGFTPQELKTTLEDLGIDSLDVTEIAMDIETEFDIEFEADASMTTVADIVAAVEEKIG